MISLVHDIIDKYNSIFIDRRDPRVDGWFLMSSPFPTLALCLSYVYIVKVLGPRFMENRKALEFRKILIIYNAIQVAFSLWLFIEFGMGGWFRGYSYICQPVDYSHGEIAIRMVYAAWWYYFSKFTEFLDTIFFVLRKKQEHVSTLHVIHHGVMPMSVWFGVKFTPGGHSTFFGLLNSFVHIVMYFYYMMSAMGPNYTKYLWWKKHLTTLQMIQFVLIFAHSFQLAFVNCDYPRGFMWWIGGHAVLFFFLFAEFYKKAYNRRLAKAAKQSKMDIISSVIPCTLFDDGTTKLNGHANGHIPNGKTNGYANGHANGHANGYANGSVRQRPKENGHAAKHD